MKVIYKFITGEKTEVEVSEEIGTVIVDSRREEHANNERHRYHTAFSLDDATYEGDTFADDSRDPQLILEAREDNTRLRKGLDTLTPIQRRRFLKFAAGMSMAAIARSEKTAFNSVKESIEAAQKNMKDFI